MDTTPSERPQARTDSHGRIPGRWLAFGRGLWVAGVVGALAVYALALPDWFDQLRTAAASSPSPASYSLTAEEITALERRGVTLDFYALAIVTAQTVAVVFAVIVGAVIFWRRRDDWLALIVGLWLILIPTNAPIPPGAVLAEANRAWFGPVYAYYAMFVLIQLLAFTLFPTRRFHPRWWGWVVATWTPVALLLLHPSLTWVDSPPAFAAALGSNFTIALAGIVQQYRHTVTAEQRVQVKWASFGMIGGFTIAFVSILVRIVTELHGDPFLHALANLVGVTAFFLSLVVLNVGFGFSILRYRLWDIDVLGDTTPNPQGFFTAASPAVCVDGAGGVISGRVLPDGGYLKLYTNFRIDTAASLTGTCYYCVGGQFFGTQLRYLMGVDIWQYHPTQTAAHNFLFASYHSQSMDTRSGTGIGTYLSEAGTHQYTFQSKSYANNCVASYSSSVVSLTINAMSCKPEWFIDANDTINYHAPLGNITIAVPAGFSAAQAPAEAAAAAWSTTLGRTITVQANSTCSPTDPLCVSFLADHGTRDGDSGCASFDTASPNAAGEWTGSTAVRFEPNWSGAHADNLRRLIAHELGHYFGLHNRVDASCGSADTVMGAFAVNCYSSDPPVAGTLFGPSASDVSAIQNSTYGNHVRVRCGW